MARGLIMGARINMRVGPLSISQPIGAGAILAAALCCGGAGIIGAFSDGRSGDTSASAPAPVPANSPTPASPAPLAAPSAVANATCLPPDSYPFDPHLPVVNGLVCTWNGKEWRWGHGPTYAPMTSDAGPPPLVDDPVSEDPEPTDEGDDDPAIVTPGAYCRTPGAVGITSSGTSMVCRGPGRERWRRPL